MNNRIFLRNVLTAAAIVLFMITGIAACGGGKKAQVQAPVDFIKNYIAKHETMVDTKLADFYMPDEQAGVAELVNKSIEVKRAAGTLANLQNASFDFSSLSIKVLDNKKEYVDDQPESFLKISISGNFTLNLGDDSRQIPTDNVLILEKYGSAWKVTEKFNPWG